MIYAATPEEIEARRKAFLGKWRVKHRDIADSLEGCTRSSNCRGPNGPRATGAISPRCWDCPLNVSNWYGDRQRAASGVSDPTPPMRQSSHRYRQADSNAMDAA